jgi:hypothetical protein
MNNNELKKINEKEITNKNSRGRKKKLQRNMVA